MFIQQEAEHFYNSYLILKENRESLIQQKSISTNKVEKISNFGHYPTMGVEIVCLSFSVELYIKSLHYVVSQDVPRGHNILSLFRKLPNHIQEELFCNPSVEKYGWDFDEFEEMIYTISDSFEKWRYSYESTSLKYNSYFALVFVEAIRNTIKSVRHRR
ncbi:HEPN domain-containing protein [Rhodohalobacter mucosus]|nr:HEPN domain-containing protein [Rhodohalobacter mucosus]